MPMVSLTPAVSLSHLINDDNSAYMQQAKYEDDTLLQPLVGFCVTHSLMICSHLLERNARGITRRNVFLREFLSEHFSHHYNQAHRRILVHRSPGDLFDALLLSK